MSHVRYPRAAVASGIAAKSPSASLRQKYEPGTSPAPLVLWASHPLRVRDGGRLIGVRRLSQSEAEVALIAPGNLGVQWFPASLFLTEQAAQRWLMVARFSR